MRHTHAMNPFPNIFTIAKDHGPVRALYIRANDVAHGLCFE